MCLCVCVFMNYNSLRKVVLDNQKIPVPSKGTFQDSSMEVTRHTLVTLSTLIGFGVFFIELHCKTQGLHSYSCTSQNCMCTVLLFQNWRREREHMWLRPSCSRSVVQGQLSKVLLLFIAWGMWWRKGIDGKSSMEMVCSNQFVDKERIHLFWLIIWMWDIFC